MRRALPLLLAVVLTGALGQQASAATDEIPHRTSWVGETIAPEDAAEVDPGRRVQVRVKSIWVDPRIADGRVYTNANMDEGRRENSVYRYDQGALRPDTWLKRQGIGGTVITGDDKYFYADFTRFDNGVRLLVRFQRGGTPVNGAVPTAPFPGGDLDAYNQPTGRKLSGKPGGVSAGRGLVFVTRPEENTLSVYERETMTVVATHSVPNPGAVAFRHATGSLFVLSDDASGNRVVRELQVAESGAVTPRATITDVGAAPVALAANGSRLYIADNGPAAQQVRIYSDCALCPQKYLLVDKLGQPGGVNAGGGAYADDRFDNLTGVGVDDAGNVYVASNLRGDYGRLDIRRFSPQKALQATLASYLFQDALVPDPRNPAELYSVHQKFTLDYSRTTPGQEWSPKNTQLTVDRVSCPHDGRFARPGTDAIYLSQPLAVRYLTGADGVSRKYLFVRGGGMLGIYRFDGGFARPAAIFSASASPWPDGTPSGPGRSWWVDGNADCRFAASERHPAEGQLQFVESTTSVSADGTLWARGIYPKQVYRFKIVGWDSGHIPRYDNGTLVHLPDAPLDMIQHAQYDDVNDRMYVYGYRGDPPSPTASPRYIVARYDNFSTANRRVRWHTDMGYVPCVSNNYDFCVPYAMSVAGNRVYVGDVVSTVDNPGRVRVYDADNGAYQGSLYAGPEVARTAGFLDIPVTSVSAVALPSGEHVVFREESYLSRILMYRYRPAG